MYLTIVTGNLQAINFYKVEGEVSFFTRKAFYSPLPLERGTGVRLFGEGLGVRLERPLTL